MLDLINRAIKYKTEEVVAGLLHLGIAPLKKIANLLESMQHKAPRMIPDLRHMEYPNRLRAPNITTLETESRPT